MGTRHHDPGVLQELPQDRRMRVPLDDAGRPVPQSPGNVARFALSCKFCEIPAKPPVSLRADALLERSGEITARGILGQRSACRMIPSHR
jgi:hypothetical protein